MLGRVLVDLALAEEVAVQAAESREMARDGAAAESGCAKVVEVGAEALDVHRCGEFTAGSFYEREKPR